MPTCDMAFFARSAVLSRSDRATFALLAERRSRTKCPCYGPAKPAGTAVGRTLCPARAVSLDQRCETGRACRAATTNAELLYGVLCTLGCPVAERQGYIRAPCGAKVTDEVSVLRAGEAGRHGRRPDTLSGTCGKLGSAL